MIKPLARLFDTHLVFSIQGKAVALDVCNMEKRQGGADGGDWQQTKKQKKKLKRNIQRYLENQFTNIKKCQGLIT